MCPSWHSELWGWFPGDGHQRLTEGKSEAGAEERRLGLENCKQQPVEPVWQLCRDAGMRLLARQALPDSELEPCDGRQERIRVGPAEHLESSCGEFAQQLARAVPVVLVHELGVAAAEPE